MQTFEPNQVCAANSLCQASLGWGSHRELPSSTPSKGLPHTAPAPLQLPGRLGVIAKFCIYNVLAHAYTIRDFSSYVVMSSCVTQIRDELVVSIMQGTHQAGIHYFILENAYLEFSLKIEKQLRLVKNQQPPLPYETPQPLFLPAQPHPCSSSNSQPAPQGLIRSKSLYHSLSTIHQGPL